MDLILTALIVAAVTVIFIVALRAYTRRRVAHRDTPVDTD